MPTAKPRPLDFWANAPHLYSLSAWRMHLRARPWGWLDDAIARCAREIGGLPPEYARVVAEEHAYKGARPWLKRG